MVGSKDRLVAWPDILMQFYSFKHDGTLYAIRIESATGIPDLIEHVVHMLTISTYWLDTLLYAARFQEVIAMVKCRKH